jgi:hypothetical protein
MARAALDPSYHASASGSGVRFHNLAQGFEVEVENEGFAVRIARESADRWLRTRTLRCDGRENEIDPGEPSVRANRAELRRGPVREWMINGAPGLEHGFTLSESACPKSTRAVQVDVEVVGMRADAAVDGAALLGPRGTTLRYSHLRAHDARGIELPASMRISPARIELLVDTSRANWPITIDPLLWVETRKITASDGAAQETFGYHVAVSGDTAVVGAPGSSIGAAYVYVRNGTSWVPQQKLTPSDGAPFDAFGGAVAISGDTILVSSFLDDLTHADQGSVYVFVRNGSTWSEQQKLFAADGAAQNKFGRYLALDGDTAAIGPLEIQIGTQIQQGAVYIFERTGTTWTQRQRLTASDAARFDFLGTSLSLHGNRLLVGAQGDDDEPNNYANRGAAYVFVSTDGTWVEHQKLVASDGDAFDLFGRAVALHGDTALVAAVKQDGAGVTRGRVYAFRESGSVWSERQTLLQSDVTQEASFGSALDVGTNVAVIAAPTHAFDGSSGAAYFFERTSATWVERQILSSSDGVENDLFGNAVALDGYTALIGAAEADIGANVNQGAAYVFALTGGSCATNTECATGFCVNAVCCRTACAGVCEHCGGATAGTCTRIADGGPPKPPGCSGFACNGTNSGCPDSCSSDADCVGGYECVATVCIPITDAGGDGAGGADGSDGGGLSGSGGVGGVTPDAAADSGGTDSSSSSGGSAGAADGAATGGSAGSADGAATGGSTGSSGSGGTQVGGMAGVGGSTGGTDSGSGGVMPDAGAGVGGRGSATGGSAGAGGAGRDGGAGAATGGAAGGEDDGCSCRTTPSRSHLPPGALMLSLTFATWTYRRRRR